MKLHQFDRPSLRAVLAEIEEALKPVAEKYGIDIRVKGASFEPKRFTTKIEASVVAEDGQVTSREADAFTKYAHAFGLKADDLGKTILLRGKPYTIVGLRTSAPKRPILLHDANGRAVVAGAGMVNNALRPPVFASVGPAAGGKSV